MEICPANICTGCAACANLCPQNAIRMQDGDQLGHIRPEIAQELCIDCGLCQKQCPTVHPVKEVRAEKAYAVWSIEEDDRFSSASGGAASVFYQKIIEEGGVAVGCCFDKNCDLQFMLAETAEEAKQFKSSKYVQSRVGDVFRRIKTLLLQDEKVLFIGTPCQTAGLLSFLGKDYGNLISVDLICHGVPSQKLLKEHIRAKEQKAQSTANRLTFRYGADWELTLYSGDMIFYKKRRETDLYFIGFLNALFYRQSCYSCAYAKPERVSDLTIGDFWGIGKEKPFAHPVEKVSVVLPNTLKGAAFLESCREKLFMEERTVDEAVAGNAQLRRPCEPHTNREKFQKLYPKLGFEGAARDCLREDLKVGRKQYVMTKIKKPVKKAMGLFIKSYR